MYEVSHEPCVPFMKCICLPKTKIISIRSSAHRADTTIKLDLGIIADECMECDIVMMLYHVRMS